MSEHCCNHHNEQKPQGQCCKNEKPCFCRPIKNFFAKLFGKKPSEGCGCHDNKAKEDSCCCQNKPTQK